MSKVSYTDAFGKTVILDFAETAKSIYDRATCENYPDDFDYTHLFSPRVREFWWNEVYAELKHVPYRAGDKDVFAWEIYDELAVLIKKDFMNGQ